MARDSITNRAAIYFDFNAAVHTNTAVTKIVYPIGVQPPGEQYEFVIFPNPANSTSFIELNASDPASLQVTLLNIQGKMVSFEVHHVESGINSINLHTENLSSGIYLVRMVIDGNLVVKKLVKM
ncbi:MAG: T9SS type A sorting domain-containing protein [Bacteroidetes bacterium]|nr:T9SS type A sorting domain-containing protein [Bacteroidota bacterium]